MPELLDQFDFIIDAAFEAGDETIDVVDDDPATTLLEFLSSAGARHSAPARKGSRRLVTLIGERDER